MGTVLFVAAVIAMAIILFWYVYDEAYSDGRGKSGLLAMESSAEPEADGGGRQDWRDSGNRPWRVRRR